jgi:hypothetical protein
MAMKAEDFKLKFPNIKRYVTKTLKCVFWVFVLLLAVYGLFAFVTKHGINPLSREKEITSIMVEEKLNQIGELATSSFTYSGTRRETSTRQLFGVDIPLTENSVDIDYTGVIKVGYQLEGVHRDIDVKNKYITIKLPEPQVLDNYIIYDKLHCSDSNNILNPISSEQVTDYFNVIEQEELEKAVAQGIYEVAESQLKTIIVAFLADLDGYQVKFV